MKRIYNYYPENISIPADAKIKVENLTSPRTGSPVANQFAILIPFNGIRRFQSYETTCLVWDGEVLTVYPEAFGRSVTTSKYSRRFLEDYCGFTSAEVDGVKVAAKTEEFGRDCPLFLAEKNGVKW